MNRFLVAWPQKHPYGLPPLIILIGLVFATSVSLACNAPTNDGELEATQIALNVQATQLSYEDNQAKLQSATNAQVDADQSLQNSNATQTAQAATQIALDVQSTINAQIATEAAIITPTSIPVETS